MWHTGCGRIGRPCPNSLVAHHELMWTTSDTMWEKAIAGGQRHSQMLHNDVVPAKIFTR